MTAQELAAREARREERLLKESLRRPRLSKGHIRNVIKHMCHIRACRQKCQRPRSVPRKVLETVIALSLV
jgi:hypothetical protein